MNIEQAKASVGKRVLCFNEQLKDNELWIASTTESKDGLFCSVSLRSSTGQHYDVGIDEIDFLPEQELVVDMSPLHRELRKEIAFALIHEGHDVDYNFKDKVDTVFDAITG